MSLINAYSGQMYNQSSQYMPAPGSYAYAVSASDTDNTTAAAKPADSGSKTEKVAGGKCETCSRRRYIDKSNESNVSFQSARHIDPSASASVVASHEREHVSNAIQKGNQPNAKLVRATVRLITAICPECGRRYVAGGVTDTLIQYSSNPYDEARKQIDASVLTGNTVDEKL